jgi:hypothetical protein
VSISTANGGAQTGNSLLSLNVNLKSGTNRFHGSVYEFIQNDVFESRNYFNAPISGSGFSGTGCTRDNNDPSKCKKGSNRWNQYGASIGGPIIKNKLFFFFNYQRNPVAGSSVQTGTVPTAAMRTGDFSDPRLHATIFDKNSCAGNCARTPLNGGTNILLPGQIDPIAAKTRLSPTNSNLTNNFTIVNTPTLSQWYVGMDYQLNKTGSQDQCSSRLSLTLIPVLFATWASTAQGHSQQSESVLSHRGNWTITQTMVNGFALAPCVSTISMLLPLSTRTFSRRSGYRNMAAMCP